jgi:uncharacterized protein YdbL (DUF1318 family)
MILAAMIAGLGVFAVSSHAGAATEAELRERFKERYPELLKAKSAGKIGENTQGFVEIVNSSDAADEKLAKLTDAENADRRALYALIAEEEGTTADVVAKRNALRNYEKARTGDYLKKPDGTWGQKK